MGGPDHTSNRLTNADVARLRDLTRDRRARHEAGRFVVEGIKLVEEVLRSELSVVLVCVEDGWDLPPAITSAVADHDARVVTVARHAIERVSSTRSPQPVVAEVEIPASGWDALATDGATLVALDLNDPGNLGTLMRSAEAAGFRTVVCLGDTVDPFSPKVVRASAGALFRIPVIVDRDGAAGLGSLGERGIVRYGTRMHDATPCDEADLTGRIALVLGSEAHGLRAESPVDQWLSIPMAGDTESLNVAMAGTILTYEVARQHRAGAR